jgi:hypothetical protein
MLTARRTKKTPTEERCGVEWGICPDCLGQPLSENPDHTRAWCPKCFRQWDMREVAPCPTRGTVNVADAHGGSALMCASHAARARIQITNAVVASVDIPPRGRPNRKKRSGGGAR